MQNPPPKYEDKKLEILCDERKLVGSSIEYTGKSLFTFNPLIITVLGSAAAILLKTEGIDNTLAGGNLVGYVLFGSSQLGFLLGVFNVMIMVRIRTQTIYLRYLEESINSYLGDEITVCQEIKIGPFMLEKTSAPIFLIILILFFLGWVITAGWAGAVILDKCIFFVILLVEGVAFALAGLREALATPSYNNWNPNSDY